MLQHQTTTEDFHPSTLADIYQPDVTIAIWQRELNNAIRCYANFLIAQSPYFQTRLILSPAAIVTELEKVLPPHLQRRAFVDDIFLLTDMFSCLFDLEAVGVRLAVLQKAMCPRFHTDKVPARLVTTYVGAGSQWLDNDCVMRSEGGRVEVPDHAPVNNLQRGQVALLKGEGWEGNEGRGLVHRSPQASPDEPRLVLTLDFA
ncbi:MAG TPA: DUF1826 domain-containing protein [Marinagarivorans sp.]